MRRLLKSIAVGGDNIGDITTLEDEAAIDEVRQASEDLKKMVKP